MKTLLEKINEKWFYIFADLFSKASIYLLMLIFSYLVIPEDYGLLSLFNSLVTIFFVFISLNLTSSYITKKRLEKKADFKSILSTVITFIYILNIIFAIFAIIIYIFDITLYSIPSLLFLCSITTAILNCNYELLNTILTAEGNKKKYLVLGLIFSIALFAMSLILVLVYSKISIYAIIITKMLLLLLFSVYSTHLFKKRYDLKIGIDKKILKEALKFSIPLTLHSLSGFILNYIDKFMLNDMENLVSTAIYSFWHNLSSVMMVVSTALNKAILPKFFQYKEENKDRDINKMIEDNLKLLVFLFVGYISAVGIIYPFFPSTYKSSLLIFILLTYNYLIFYGYNMYSNYLYYRGKTIKLFTNTAISGILNLVLNVILIRKYSSLGASISTIISFTTMFILYYISVRRSEKDYFPIKKFIIWFSIAGIFATIYYLLHKILLFRIISFALVIIACLVTLIYLLRKKDINEGSIK